MAELTESDFGFVVKDTRRNSVLVEFRPHDEAAKQHYLGVWHKLSQALQKHHQLVGGIVAPEWTTWKPGEWCDQQRGYENRLKFVAWCGCHLIGFLNVRPDFDSIHQTGKNVLYIEHLAARTDCSTRNGRELRGQPHEGSERRARLTWKPRKLAQCTGWRNIVPEPKIVPFKPRWMREKSTDARCILEDTPAVGAVPEGPPRLHTRLVLSGNNQRVSFKTLSEALEPTQAIVYYAACDVFHGVNPDFADLRSAGVEVLQLGKLSAEPCEEGSLLIPARLEAEAVQAPVGTTLRTMTTQDVVDPFDEILAAFACPQPATEVSIGAIQAIVALGQVLRREAGTIEDTPR